MSGDHNIHQADHIPDATKMIECGTCGYPLAEDERAGLVEVDGKMQKPWVGLTMEDVNDLYEDYDPSQWYDFVREIVAKLKEKNT